MKLVSPLRTSLLMACALAFTTASAIADEQKCYFDQCITTDEKMKIFNLVSEYKCNLHAAESNDTSCKHLAKAFCTAVLMDSGKVLNPVRDYTPQNDSPNWRGKQVVCYRSDLSEN